MKDYLARLWRGELPLQTAFWNWAVLGGIVINFVSSGMFMFLLVSDQVILALIAGYLLSVPYNLFVAVGVWRSADNYEGDRRLADAAKLVTVVGMLLLSFT
ncbi:MAG: hypothetical protein AB3N24_04450 [Leisingera sp.]